MKHTTKDGRKIKLKDLEDSHLISIIAMIERKAKTGITVYYGGGGSYGTDDIWYAEETLTGKAALEKMNHSKYAAELNRRIKVPKL